MSRNNFRVNFLEKISVSGVESGESLSAEAARRLLKEQILNESSDVDLGKLAQFAAKHQIPHCYRIGVWKLLLGISACHAEGRTVVEQHRKEEAEMLLKSLQVMRKTSCGISADSPAPSSIEIVAMIKLSNPSISISALCRSTPFSTSDKALTCIANQMVPLCSLSSLSNGWIDAYLLTSRLFELLSNTFEEDPQILWTLIDDVKSHIRMIQNRVIPQIAAGTSRTLNAQNSLNLFEFFTDECLKIWFCSGGSSLLSADPLYRLWDLLCCGETISAILRISLNELITIAAQHASENNTSAQFERNLMTRDVQMKAINQATENFSKTGGSHTKKS